MSQSWKVLLIGIGAVIDLVGRTGTVEASLLWTANGYQYDTGNWPSVAFGFETPGVWQEVHQGTYLNMWYHNGSYIYQQGDYPTIASDTLGNYIEIHQGNGGNGSFWYTLGFDSGDGLISWGSASSNDSGELPVIALHGHSNFANIVQVHQGGSGLGSLWMNVAQATNINQGRWGGVNWYDAQQYAPSGARPSVAVEAVSPGILTCYLEVHQSGIGLSTVTWTSGAITYGNATWSYDVERSGTLATNAQHASACLYDGSSKDHGVVVIEGANGQLTSFDGPFGADPGIADQNCVWFPENSHNYDTGYYPRISCQTEAKNGVPAAVGIEVHQGANSSSNVPLWYHTFSDSAP